MDNVKPCPFCGSYNIKVDKCTARVRCKDCFATSGLISKYLSKTDKKEDAALMAWNTRVYEENNR